MKKAIENNKLKIIQQYSYTITTKQMRWGNAEIIAIPNDIKKFNDGKLMINLRNYNQVNIFNDITKNNLMIDNKIQQKDSSKILSFLIDEKEYFLRVLTPRECWLLMGFRNKDFYKASKVVSDTQLYKQADNSIVVCLLEKIFTAMFQIEKKN